jgi:hypothetical protein
MKDISTKGESAKGAIGRMSSGRVVPFMICAAGVIFIVLGMSRGEAAAVLMKAIHICLECIGIG